MHTKNHITLNRSTSIDSLKNPLGPHLEAGGLENRWNVHHLDAILLGFPLRIAKEVGWLVEGQSPACGT